jgi:hypothetical protein
MRRGFWCAMCWFRLRRIAEDVFDFLGLSGMSKRDTKTPVNQDGFGNPVRSSMA